MFVKLLPCLVQCLRSLGAIHKRRTSDRKGNGKKSIAVKLGDGIKRAIGAIGTPNKKFTCERCFFFLNRIVEKYKNESGALSIYFIS